MKLIKLTQGKFAQVDDADFDWLNQWKWNLISTHNLCYARGHINGQDVLMHRLILGLNKGNILQGEHKDGNGLNCQRNNLRVASHSQNMWNRKASGKTKYKGVYESTHIKNGITFKYYKACIGFNGKLHNLGQFPFTPEGELEAAKLRDKKAIEFHGEFARLNFPNPNFSDSNN